MKIKELTKNTNLLYLTNIPHGSQHIGIKLKRAKHKHIILRKEMCYIVTCLLDGTILLDQILLHTTIVQDRVDLRAITRHNHTPSDLAASSSI